MIKQGVSSCPECDTGTLVLDPVSAPKWRLDCNRCSFLIYLPNELHNAKLSKEHCEVGCRLMPCSSLQGNSESVAQLSLIIWA